MTSQMFLKYHKRINRESIIKSLLLGLIVGAAVLLVASFTVWMTEPDLLWIAVIAFALATTGFTVLFYYKKYKPTTKAIARRVDDLGLEERLLTMTELEGDDSYIARRQREDAVKAMESVGAELIKIIVSTAATVAISIVGFLALSMATVTGLSSAGILMSGQELWNEIAGAPPVYYELIYTVEGEGTVTFADGTVIGNGESFVVKVEKGKDSSEIYAESSDEWVFIEWSDGYQYPTRSEKSVNKNLSLKAIFAEISGSAGNGNATDAPLDIPSQGDDEDGKGGQGKPGSPNPNGQYEPTNKIKDNKTYYGNEWEGAYEGIQKEFEEDPSISENHKDITNGYMDGIQAEAEKEKE